MLITSFLNINVFNPLGPKSVQHQFSPNNINYYIEPILKEMYGNRSGEFLFGSWGLKG